MSFISEIKMPCLLVALPKLVDPNFHKSVVLLVEHSEEGAMGFVINRPSSVPLEELLCEDDVEVPTEIPAWYGGPLNTSNGLVLHKATDESNSSSDEFLSDEIAISSSKESLKGLIEYAKIVHEQCLSEQSEPSPTCQKTALYPFRFIAGYSGWEPNQLDQEIKEGAWLQIPMDKEIIFYTPWQNIWDEVLNKIGVKPFDIVSQGSNYIN